MSKMSSMLDRSIRKKRDKYELQRIREKRKTLALLDKAVVAVNAITYCFENYRSARVNQVAVARDMIAGKHRSLAIELEAAK